MGTDRPHRSNSIKNNNNNNISAISSSSTTTTTKSELFICFTSRLSSSSMKISSSKSILSPGRAGEPSQAMLSTSLSRRLRSNGSMRGGQASPMFRTTGSNATKKRGGCGFENPEPSSPKVTCIGQVRVKTKKQGNKMRTSGSKRRGDVSFKRLDQSNNIDASNSQDCDRGECHLNHQFANHQQQQQQQECLSHRNQRWVHLPVSICEALRAFGAEFNCFLPCRSSCMASEKEKGDKAAAAAAGSSKSSGSCGSVFARWLVSVQEVDGKEREIELVVGQEEEEEEEDDEERGESRQRRKSSRRHVFEEIEFKDEKFEGGNGNVQEEEARVSICIPPKNALLLMRCRSDPVRMAALANKFWEAPVSTKDHDGEEEEEEEDKEQEEGKEESNKTGEKDGNEEEEEGDSADEAGEDGQSVVKQELVDKEDSVCEHGWSSSNEAAVENQIQDVEAIPDVLEVGIGKEGSSAEQAGLEVSQPVLTQEIALDGCLLEEIGDPRDLQSNENEGNEVVQEDDHCRQEEKQEEQEQELEVGFGDCVQILQEESSVSAGPEQEAEAVGQVLKDQYEEQVPESPDIVPVAELAVQEESMEVGEEETLTHERPEPPDDPETREVQLGFESKEERESQAASLPDCLLLMMCEPKLSMEVSKETWVCSRDFIKWPPEHSRPPVKKTSGKDEGKKRTTIDCNPAPAHVSSQQQAPRSSCSYPAKPPARVPGTESMATVLEQRLVGVRDYEPFVLTRCKSEPMRSAGKLEPEACFWKNRKLEPHRPATLGVGTAGVGF